jgi:Mg2+ and Co2+ transporter CorA
MTFAAYRLRDGALDRTEDIAPSDWLRVTAPDAGDIARLASLGVPAALLSHLHDMNERPRARRIGDWVLAVLHFPHAQGPDAPVPYATLPLSVLVTPRNIVTVAPAPAAFLDGLASGEIEMVAIAEGILAQMMDAFASIVSNNLNGVMKVLTSATILLAIPTLVASLWGMNVLLPFAGAPWAFATIVAGCSIGIVALAWLFRRRSWL